MSNIQIGNACEKQVVEMLRKRGYWVYNTPLKANGQCVDIFAAKGNDKGYIVILLDAKHVREESPSFPFSRIEPNQLSSMSYMKNFAKLKNVGFAILFERIGNVYWLSYDLVDTLNKQGVKSVKLDCLPKFEDVLNEYDNK